MRRAHYGDCEFDDEKKVTLILTAGSDGAKMCYARRGKHDRTKRLNAVNRPTCADVSRKGGELKRSMGTVSMVKRI